MFGTNGCGVYVNNYVKAIKMGIRISVCFWKSPLIYSIFGSFLAARKEIVWLSPTPTSALDKSLILSGQKAKSIQSEKEKRYRCQSMNVPLLPGCGDILLWPGPAVLRPHDQADERWDQACLRLDITEAEGDRGLRSQPCQAQIQVQSFLSCEV